MFLYLYVKLYYCLVVRRSRIINHKIDSFQPHIYLYTCIYIYNIHMYILCIYIICHCLSLSLSSLLSPLLSPLSSLPLSLSPSLPLSRSLSLYLSLSLSLSPWLLLFFVVNWQYCLCYVCFPSRLQKSRPWRKNERTPCPDASPWRWRTESSRVTGSKGRKVKWFRDLLAKQSCTLLGTYRSFWHVFFPIDSLLLPLLGTYR